MLLFFFLSLSLFCSGASGQRVKVDQEVTSYPGQTVNLRCAFADPTGVQLSMVRYTIPWCICVSPWLVFDYLFAPLYSLNCKLDLLCEIQIKMSVIPKLELIVLTWHNTIQWNWDCSYNLLLHLKPAGIRLEVDLIFNSNYDNFPVNKVVIYSLIWFCGSVKLCLRWKKQFSSIKLTKKNQNIALCALFICHIVP